MLTQAVGITSQHSRHGTTAYYKYQCPLPILVLGLRLYSSIQTLHKPYGMIKVVFWLVAFVYAILMVSMAKVDLAEYYCLTQMVE